MRRTNQNKVPEHFKALYLPIVNLKKILAGKCVGTTASKQIIEGFVLLHYSTFLMSNLFYLINRDISLCIAIRTLAEEALATDSYNLLAESRSKVFSFIDNLGKEINTTYEPYLYVAMYSAHLDAEIYKYFNSNKGIYDFMDGYLIHPDTKHILKQNAELAQKSLNSKGLLLNKR